MHEEDHESLEGGEDAEQPLKDLRHGAVVHHKEPKHPADAQDGDQHQRGMDQGAGEGNRWREVEKVSKRTLLIARLSIDYMEPRIKDPPRRGHNRKHLSTEDIFLKFHC